MIALGIALALIIGFALTGSSCNHTSRAGRLALWFVLGTAAFTAIVVCLNLVHMSLAAAIIVAAIAGVAGSGWRFREHRILFDSREPWHWTDAVAALAVSTFGWKVAIVELWSWDHFSIWGMKARWFVETGSFSPGFLNAPEFLRSNPGYPIGFPALLTTLSLGGEIDAFTVKLLHVTFGVAVVLGVREAVRLLTGRPVAGAMAAAFVALSPIFWDTESLGLAELPLVATALVAIVIVLVPDARAAHAVAAGSLLGWMAWIKTEGTPLSFLVLATLLIGCRWRWKQRAQFGGSWLVLVLAAAVFGRFLPEGMSFFAGDSLGRAAARIKDYHVILGPVVTELARPSWLGAWIFAAIVICRRASWHRRIATSLGIAAIAQLAFYVAVYFFTYLDPVEHIDSSFYRIAAAVLPLALVAATSLLLAPEDTRADAAVVADAKFG